MSPLILVRVVAPSFVAGFETDGVVRRAAPILRRHILGMTDEQAARVIERKGWIAEAVRPKNRTPSPRFLTTAPGKFDNRASGGIIEEPNFP